MVVRACSLAERATSADRKALQFKLPSGKSALRPMFSASLLADESSW